MKINNSIGLLIFVLVVVFCFPFLFSTHLISGGDYTSPISAVIHFTANFWSWCDYTGLGFSCAAIDLHATPMWYIALLFQVIGFPTFFIERLLWWLPFFFGGLISIALLSKKILPHSSFWFVSPFIYLFNTYILMVVGGGQIAGIALGYSLTPFLLWIFIRAIEKTSVRRVIFVGLILALQIIIDPRIAFIGYFCCLMYVIFLTLWTKDFSLKSIVKYLLVTSIPTFIAGAVHAYWIFPSLVVHQNPLVQLGPAYSTTGAASYFSFATFENALGLLHPNWPENIFGKTSFMKPEFLVLPILAFASLLFIVWRKKESHVTAHGVVFLAILALIGSFLAKGAQDPFGGIYLWIFSHIPGFQLFRDPTKWYTFIAISYSLLIPFTLQEVSELFIKANANGKMKKTIVWVIVGAFTIYFAWLIHPLFQQSLTGVFVSPQETTEYKQLDTFLSSQPEFFRTLWIPTTERFGLYSVNHPVIGLTDIMPKLKKISDVSSYEATLQEMSIRYVIVPYDSVGEIFLTDRKYDENQYTKTLAEIRKTSWLQEYKHIGKIVIFKLPNSKNKFFSFSSDSQVSYVEKNPTEYIVTIKNGHKGEKVIFTDTYDSHWIATYKNQPQKSLLYDKMFNSFVLPHNGDQSLQILYTPQQWVWYGLLISALALTGCIVLLFHVR